MSARQPIKPFYSFNKRTDQMVSYRIFIQLHSSHAIYTHTEELRNKADKKLELIEPVYDCVDTNKWKNSIRIL